MSDPVLDLDQHLRSPLGALKGARPPAPAWFDAALSHAPEVLRVEVEGAGLEVLAWGERGRPGLFFLHGGRAHAHWFDHIAPAFADRYRVAAASLSGAGGSDWRPRYSVAQFAREMAAAARAAGLYAAGPPVFAAHSFGSRPLLHACADPELAPGAAVVIDSAVSAPDAPEFQPQPGRPNTVFPDLPSALARFRLLPAQSCEPLYVLDNIARTSLKPVEPAGWTWRFDPFGFDHLEGASRGDADADLRAAVCPLAFIHGGRSEIVRPANLAYTRSIAPEGTRFTAMADAGHHLFLDHPLLFVDTLRGELAALGR